jgi:hypothetical protein
MSDTIMYVISSSSGISIEGDYLLDLINVHCLPGSIIYTVVSSSNDDSISTTSSRHSLSRNLEKILQKRFSDVKLTPLDNQQDGQRFLRKLTEQKLIKPTKKCLRPYLFAQSFSYENPKVNKNFFFYNFSCIYKILLVINKYIKIKWIFTWS